MELCLSGAHPALAGLLDSGFRIADDDISMATAGLGLPVGQVYSPGLT